MVFGDLLVALPVTPPCYNTQTSSWLILKALLHVSPGSVADMFEDALTARLFVHTNPVTCINFDVRLVSRSLTHALVSSLRTTVDAFSNHCITTLLESVIKPNLQWSAGRTAAATRKAALAILLTLLKSDGEVSYNRCENTKIYVQNFPQMFPLLQTCLEDFDTSMRELAMSGLVCLLELLPRGSLDQRDAHALYPGIIKRLDDSINAVRRDALRSLVG
mmetsp:Transcript_29706/g.88803  ORF Transcript_29706/g.88803 Transcript_29706/m.88803 type:complete len:219 (-) Transcript_29706:284-940(-)